MVQQTKRTTKQATYHETSVTTTRYARAELMQQQGINQWVEICKYDILLHGVPAADSAAA
jgi:hypothetical protein